MNYKFKTPLDQFIKKFGLTKTEKDFLISQELKPIEKDEKDNKDGLSSNLDISIEEMAKEVDTKDEMIQCCEDELSKELGKMKNLRDFEKYEKIIFTKNQIIKTKEKLNLKKLIKKILYY